MATASTEFLSAHKSKGFKPVPRYFANGDYSYSFLVSSFNDSGSGISAAPRSGARRYSVGVHLDAGKLTLGFLFLVGLTLAKDDSQKHF